MFNQSNTEVERLLTPDWTASAMGGGVCIGRIITYHPSGSVTVDFDGCDEPKKARIVSDLSQDELIQAANSEREVLILFERGDIERPIIVALLKKEADSSSTVEIPKKQIGSLQQAVVDGKVVKIEAHDQIVLQCGKGSITIRKDGKILVKGTKLVSRASETNKIKGASVNIN